MTRDARADAQSPVVRAAADELVPVTVTVNGTRTSLLVPARMTLADALRERLGLTGTHLGCEHGVCGMCTVLHDGEAARSCLLFAVQCEGADITTIEGLGRRDDPHPLQQAFSHHHALQCGFCTPGFVLSAYDLLTNEPSVAAEELPRQLSGVLCRCTGYRNIVAAVADVADRYPDGLPAPTGCGPRTIPATRPRPAPARVEDLHQAPRAEQRAHEVNHTVARGGTAHHRPEPPEPVHLAARAAAAGARRALTRLVARPARRGHRAAWIPRSRPIAVSLWQRQLERLPRWKAKRDPGRSQ